MSRSTFIVYGILTLANLWSAYIIFISVFWRDQLRSSAYIELLEISSIAERLRYEFFLLACVGTLFFGGVMMGIVIGTRYHFAEKLTTSKLDSLY